LGWLALQNRHWSEGYCAPAGKHVPSSWQNAPSSSYWQPSVGSQLSVVQGRPSSQSAAVAQAHALVSQVPTQLPTSSQLALVMQLLPESQPEPAARGSTTHWLSTHALTAQGPARVAQSTPPQSPASQGTSQAPWAHWPGSGHEPSRQTAPSGEVKLTQPSNASQTSSVQGSPSSHSGVLQSVRDCSGSQTLQGSDAGDSPAA